MALSFSVHAENLSLGSMTLFKSKGQPTYAEITISGAAQGDAAKLRARVASPEAYRAAGLRYAAALSQITVTSRQADGRVGLRLDIPDSAADGSLDLLLLVGDAVSVAMAEYRLDFTGTARVFPALEAGTALIPSGPQVAAASTSKAPTIAALSSKSPTPTVAATRAASAPTSVATSASTGVVAAKVNKTETVATALRTGSPVPASASTPAMATATAAASAADSAATSQAAAALAAWADAWSRRDVDAYVAMYTADFSGRTRPPSHATWVAERRARIESKRAIEVKVSSLSVLPKANQMVLTFTQAYSGDGLRQTSRKRLTFKHEGDRWLIQEEAELP